jgi:hypothetical protein
MTTIRWRKPKNGDFARAQAWFHGAVPGPDDRASLTAAGASFTVTSSVDETVRALSFSANAMLAITGGTFTVTAGTEGGADYGQITVAGGATLQVGRKLDNRGVVDVGQRGSLVLLGDTTLRGRGTIIDDGTVAVSSGGPSTVVNQNDTISGGGQLEVSGVAGAAFINGPKGVIDANGGEMGISGGVMTNDGLIENVGANRLDIYSNVDGEGSIVVGKGALLELQESVTVSGQTISVATGGEFAFSYDGTVDYGGVLNNAGAVQIQGYGPTPALFVQGQATFSGGGTITVFDAPVFGGAGTLVNADNSIVFRGDFNGGNAVADLGDGQLNIVNQAAGVIEVVAAGNIANQLLIDCGAGTLTNAGLIDNEGGSQSIEMAGVVSNSGTIVDNAGSITMDGALVNAGAVEVTGVYATVQIAGAVSNRGTITLDDGYETLGGALANAGMVVATNDYLTVDGAVTGNGELDMLGGANVTLEGKVNQDIGFEGQYAGTLNLALAINYRGAISGFSSGESLVLDDIGFVNASEATFSGNAQGGVLTVSDGVHVASIDLVGDYLSSVFTASADGAGVKIQVNAPLEASQTSLAPASRVHGFIAHAAALSAPCGVVARAEMAMTPRMLWLARP